MAVASSFPTIGFKIQRLLLLRNIRYVLITLLVVLAIVLLARFSRYLQMASEHTLDPDVIIYAVLWRIPDFIAVILPFALMVGAALLLTHLHHAGELQAWYNSGLSRLSLLFIVLAPALLLLPLNFAFCLQWAPIAKQHSNVLLKQSDKDYWWQRINNTQLRRGDSLHIFANPNQSAQNSVDLKKPTLVARQSDNSLLLMVSDDGYLQSSVDGNLLVTLNQGVSYRDAGSALGLQIVDFTSMRSLLYPVAESEKASLGVRHMPVGLLWQQADSRAFSVIIWRFSLALAGLFGVLISFVVMGGAKLKRAWNGKRIAFLAPLYWLYLSLLVYMRDITEKLDNWHFGNFLMVFVIFHIAVLFLLYLSNRTLEH